MDVKPLAGRVREFTRRATPSLAGGRAVLAVSGGGDSVAMTSLLVEAGVVRCDGSVVAHFDHRLRTAAESGRDREAVASLCRRYGIDLVEGAWAQPRRGEAAAREARYRFLAATSRDRGLSAVATGHTRDDHVETVVMHALRGCGLHGLRGIAAEGVLPLTDTATADGAGDRTRLARPVLEVSRDELRAWCAARSLDYVDDASNENRGFLRNRVRHDVLPAIEAMQPGARAAIERVSREAGDAVVALEAVAKGALRPADETIASPHVVLSREALRGMPPAVAPYAYRLAVEDLLGDARELGRGHYQRLAAVASGATGATYELPRRLWVTVDRDAVVVSLGPLMAAVVRAEDGGPLPYRGAIGGWDLDVREVDDAACGPGVMRLPEDAIVRGRRPGDRMRPRGMTGHKKLQDVYVDRRVPRRERDAAPVIACGRDVLWTPFAAAEPSGGRLHRVEARRAASPVVTGAS